MASTIRPVSGSMRSWTARFFSKIWRWMSWPRAAPFTVLVHVQVPTQNLEQVASGVVYCDSHGAAGRVRRPTARVPHRGPCRRRRRPCPSVRERAIPWPADVAAACDESSGSSRPPRAAPFLLRCASARVRLLALLARGDPTHEASRGPAPGGGVRCSFRAPRRGRSPRPVSRSCRRRRRARWTPWPRRTRSAWCSRSRWSRSDAIPATVSAPFFHITPALPGVLPLVGDAHPHLHARGPARAAVRDPLRRHRRRRRDLGRAGRPWAQPYTFSFTTPTAAAAADDVVPARGPLRPPGRPRSCASTSPSRTPRWSRTWPSRSSRTPSSRRCLPATSARPPIAAALQAFAAKVAQARRERGPVTAPIAVRPTEDWDKKALSARGRPPRPSRRRRSPPPDTWIRVAVGAAARGVAGQRRRRARRRSKTVQLEPTLFVDGFRCRRACDPDGYNPLRFRGRVRRAAALRRAVQRVGRHRSRAAARRSRRQRRRARRRRGRAAETEDALRPRLQRHARGRRVHRRSPARTYAVTVDAGPHRRRRPGARLHLDGARWRTGIAARSRASAAGHGVWESGGGADAALPRPQPRTVTQWLRAAARRRADADRARARRRSRSSSAPTGAGTRAPPAPAAPTPSQSAGIDLAPGARRRGHRPRVGGASRTARPSPRAIRRTASRRCARASCRSRTSGSR